MAAPAEKEECTLTVKYEIFYPKKTVRKPEREYHFSLKTADDPLMRDVARSPEGKSFRLHYAEHTERDIPIKFPLTVFAQGVDWDAQPEDDSPMRCKITVTRSDHVPVAGGTAEGTAGRSGPGEVADIVKCGKTLFRL